MGLAARVGLEHRINLEWSPTGIRKNCWAATSRGKVGMSWAGSRGLCHFLWKVLQRKSSHDEHNGRHSLSECVNLSQAGVAQRPLGVGE